MKLTVIWFSIGVTALAIVAPASTNKYDVQTDLTTILARDSMAPSPETEHECMEACVDAALLVLVAPSPTSPSYHKAIF
ncbi:hypothetical protein D6C76_01045 [Aureobasidium pullulans]|nr:hypothetical protein D6C76_01045 [Aureobasidium pullulans]